MLESDLKAYTEDMERLASQDFNEWVQSHSTDYDPSNIWVSWSIVDRCYLLMSGNDKVLQRVKDRDTMNELLASIGTTCRV